MESLMKLKISIKVNNNDLASIRTRTPTYAFTNCPIKWLDVSDINCAISEHVDKKVRVVNLTYREEMYHILYIYENMNLNDFC